MSAGLVPVPADSAAKASRTSYTALIFSTLSLHCVNGTYAGYAPSVYATAKKHGAMGLLE